MPDFSLLLDDRAIRRLHAIKQHLDQQFQRGPLINQEAINRGVAANELVRTLSLVVGHIDSHGHCQPPISVTREKLIEHLRILLSALGGGEKIKGKIAVRSNKKMLKQVLAGIIESSDAQELEQALYESAGKIGISIEELTIEPRRSRLPADHRPPENIRQPGENESNTERGVGG